MTSPIEELIERIVPLFSGLLLPEDIAKCKAKIASGTMKAEDWLLAIENSLDKERSE